MTRRSMPSSFHANLFALVGARWRLLNMRRLLVSRHLARSGGFSLSVPKHRRCLDPNLPKRDRFILVGFIWANVVVYRNVVVGDVLV